jgi:hypothetical protein
MRSVALVAGLLVFSGLAHSQTFGAINGEVTDSTGAVMPNVTVTATNTGTNIARTTQTNSVGQYNFPDLVPAAYQIKVTADGFQTTVANLELQVQQTAKVDLVLTVGQASQTVEVSADAAALTTESATVGTVIAEKTITEMPLNGRNFLQLVALAPNVSVGFVAPSQASNRQGGDRALQSYSVAGMRGTWNNYTLDGVSNTDPNFNLYVQLPSIDAIQEFKVQSGIYPAEFGREAAQINVSTKAGTNDFHGTLFEFLRNSELDAKPYDFIGTRPPKAPFKQNQYGYYLGGPVWLPKIFNGRNKVFFASNWEGYKSRLQNTGNFTVIPDAWRNGDFSGLLAATDPITGKANSPVVLYDPQSRVQTGSTYTAQPFSGNLIPKERLDPVSQKLLAFLPHATINPNNTTSPNSNFQYPQSNQVNKNQVTERIDFNQNASSQWFGRFGWTSENTVNPTLPDTGGALSTNSKQYVLSNAWVLSPSKVNEVRFGYTSIFNAVTDQLAGQRDVVKELNLPFSPEIPQSWGIPAVSMSNGLSSWGDNTNGPFVIDDSTMQFIDNFSWTHGKHSFRFGGEYRRDVFSQFGNQYTRGNPQFNGNFTATPQTLAGGNSAADFILGAPFRLDLALQLAVTDDRSNSLAFYFDDTWKLTPKITISTGLRWEVVQPWKDLLNNKTNFDFKNIILPQAANVPVSQWPVFVRAGNDGNFYNGLDYVYVNGTGVGPAGPIPVARDGRLGDRLVDTDWNNFAPRFGIAYSPNSKWSIRTGLGVFFSQETANSKFDINRGSAGRLTDLPDPRGKISLTYGNSYDPKLTPYPLTPGLTWAVQKDIATPYSLLYLFDIQRQFGSATTLELVYQGAQHRKVQNQYNGDAGIPGVAAAQTRVPFPMYSSGIEITGGYGRGNYNGLSTKLTQRYKSGLSTLVSFTWSKAMDNGSAIRGTTGDQYPENPYCVVVCEYGPSGFNTPLRFVTSANYDLPFGAGKRFLNHGGVINAVIGGWQTSGIFTAQSGRVINTVSWDAAGQVIQPNSNRMTSTGISPYADTPTANGWWNPKAFILPLPANCVGTVTPGCYDQAFGNMQRNGLIGPSTWDADISVFKNFRIREKTNFQFRMEGFNMLNHVALGTPNASWGNSTCNTRVNCVQAPSASFGLIRDSATAIGTAYTMRQIQLAAKITF